MPITLPTFKEYTVDIRLQQFRKVVDMNIEFIDFNSEKGEILLTEYIKSLKKDSKEFHNLLKSLDL